MNKAICTTTINPPTEALRKFAAMEGWHLIVAGDLKTPSETGKLQNTTYLSPGDQEHAFPLMSRAIPWNCIQRRNLAFLWACVVFKADIIATVDDDNTPMDNWGKRVDLLKPVEHTAWIPNGPAFNPLEPATMPAGRGKLRHRGFPIQLSLREPSVSIQLTDTFHIQANLWNGSPDIDAVQRIIDGDDGLAEAVSWSSGFPYGSQYPAPFNSQNTILTREAMPHYFMFPHIGRMDDIWAAYHCHGQGYRPLFHEVTVRQDRNPHDTTKDFEAEVLGYRLNHAICMELMHGNKRAVLDRLPEESRLAFQIYQQYFE